MEKFEFYGAPDIDREMTEKMRVIGPGGKEKYKPMRPGPKKPSGSEKKMAYEGMARGFWDEQFEQTLQERMSPAERQSLLHKIRQKQRGKQTPDKDDKKPRKGKLPSWGRRK